MLNTWKLLKACLLLLLAFQLPSLQLGMYSCLTLHSEAWMLHERQLCGAYRMTDVHEKCTDGKTVISRHYWHVIFLPEVVMTKSFLRLVLVKIASESCTVQNLFSFFFYEDFKWWTVAKYVSWPSPVIRFSRCCTGISKCNFYFIYTFFALIQSLKFWRVL